MKKTEVTNELMIELYGRYHSFNNMTNDVNEKTMYSDFNKLSGKYKKHKENIRSMFKALSDEVQKLSE